MAISKPRTLQTSPLLGNPLKGFSGPTSWQGTPRISSKFQCVYPLHPEVWSFDPPSTCQTIVLVAAHDGVSCLLADKFAETYLVNDYGNPKTRIPLFVNAWRKYILLPFLL